MINALPVADQPDDGTDPETTDQTQLKKTGQVSAVTAPTTTGTVPLTQSVAPATTPAPLSTSDPLAFAPAPEALPTANLAPVDVPTFPTGGTAPAPAPASTPAPAPAPATSSAPYNPFDPAQNPTLYTGAGPMTDAQKSVSATAGLTPDELFLYGLGQGVPVSASGTSYASQLSPYITPATQAGTSATVQPGYADELAQLTGQNADAIKAVTDRVTSKHATDITNQNAAADAYNSYSELGDYQSYIDGLRNAGAVGDLPTIEQWSANIVHQPLIPGAATAASAPSGSAGGSGGTPTPRLSPGAPNDAGSPSSGVGASFPIAPGTGGPVQSGNPGAGAATGNANGTGNGSANGLPSTSASQGPNNGVNLTPLDPNNALTSQVISPGPGTDRFAIAKTQLDDFIKSSDPAYQASLRDANRYNFARGRGVSGIANNSIGDIQTQRDNAIRGERDSVLGNALTGSIDDAYHNIGIAQQQQGFERLLQNDAFTQALQQLTAGSTGDPAQIALVLSQIFGSLGGQSGQAATSYASANQNATNSNAAFNSFLQWLQSQQANGVDPLAGVSTTVPPISITPGGGYP